METFGPRQRVPKAFKLCTQVIRSPRQCHGQIQRPEQVLEYYTVLDLDLWHRVDDVSEERHQGHRLQKEVVVVRTKEELEFELFSFSLTDDLASSAEGGWRHVYGRRNSYTTSVVHSLRFRPQAGPD